MISPTGSVPRQVGIFAHLVSTVASGDASLAQVASVALLPGFWIHGFAAHSKGRVFAALATVAIVATLTQVTASLPVRFKMPLFYRGIFAPGRCNCNYKTLMLREGLKKSLLAVIYCYGLRRLPLPPLIGN